MIYLLFFIGLLLGFVIAIILFQIISRYFDKQFEKIKTLIQKRENYDDM